MAEDDLIDVCYRICALYRRPKPNVEKLEAAVEELKGKYQEQKKKDRKSANSSPNITIVDRTNGSHNAWGGFISRALPANATVSTNVAVSNSKSSSKANTSANDYEKNKSKSRSPHSRSRSRSSRSPSRSKKNRYRSVSRWVLGVKFVDSWNLFFSFLIFFTEIAHIQSPNRKDITREALQDLPRHPTKNGPRRGELDWFKFSFSLQITKTKVHFDLQRQKVPEERRQALQRPRERPRQTQP